MTSDTKILEEIKQRLGLERVFPVTEGGWFLPTTQGDQGRFEPPTSAPPLGESGIDTLIKSETPWSSGFYLLTNGRNAMGALHTLKCDEHYILIAGDSAELCTITPGGTAEVHQLSASQIPQHVVAGNMVHGVRRIGGKLGYTLFYLTTVPAFDPADAVVNTRSELLARFPAHMKLIGEFTHDTDPGPPVVPVATSFLESFGSIEVKPILTVGDSVAGYRLVGGLDGIGAYRDPVNSNCMRVLLTHELEFIQGGVRTHGAAGAFVSEWCIDLSEWKSERKLSVLSGEDLIREFHYWSSSKQRFRHGKFFPIERLCSADLPPVSATKFEEKGQVYGTNERMFLGGEESHTKYRPDHGRAIAHVVTGEHRGKSWELPKLGRCSYENVPLCPYPQRKTVAIGLDDATTFTAAAYSKRNVTSEVYVYVGEKSVSNDPPIAAGLHDGQLYGLQVFRMVDGNTHVISEESRDQGFGGYMEASFRLVKLSDPSKDDPFDEPGVAQQKESLRLNITRFLRVEDGAWDPRDGHQSKFYFVTTDEFDGNPRLFRLTFYDIEAPERGGDIEILLQAREGDGFRFRMLDSLTVDPWGRVILQEDSGNNESSRSTTMVFDPDNRDLRKATITSSSLFGSGEDALTHDEETSGIIPVFDLLGEGWYLTNVQAHSKGKFSSPVMGGLTKDQASRLERHLVEDGQLLAVKIGRDISDLPKI